MDNKNFQIENGRLIKYLGNEEKVVIPEGVVSIARSAFIDALLMKEVILPTTLEVVDKVIATDVYGYDYKIEKVVIDSLEHWLSIDFKEPGSNFMYKNTKLYISDKVADTITIPGHIKVIKKNAFINCQSIKKVIVEEGVEAIEDGAFASSSLEEITLPNSLIQLGKNEKQFGFTQGVFFNCINLKELTIPSGIKKLPRRLLDRCKSLKVLNLPKGLEVIESDAISYLDSMEVIDLPEGLKEFAISTGTNTKQINIPSSVIKITGFNVQGIKNIYFPDGIKIIENLSVVEPETIRIPNSLEKLDIRKIISFAHDKKELITKTRYNEYQGGLYIGNEDNPYLALVALDDETCPKEFFIHENCKLLVNEVFTNDIVEIVHLPKDIRYVGRLAFHDSKSLKKIINPGHYDLEKEDKCIYNCPNLEKENGGLLGKQIVFISNINKDEYTAKEEYQITLREHHFRIDAFETKLVYKRHASYKNGIEVTLDETKISEDGISKYITINLFEKLKDKVNAPIDINELDKELFDLLLGSLYGIIQTVSLLDIKPYKDMKYDFDCLSYEYDKELSKYSDEELETLLTESIDDVEIEKINLIRALRNKEGGNDDNEYFF